MLSAFTIIKEKIYSQAKVEDDKVFDLDRVAIKVEWQCSSCNESIFLFDLGKLDSKNYNYFKCKKDNIIFSAPGKITRINKIKLMFFRRFLSSIKLPNNLTPNKGVICPNCNNQDIEHFNPKIDKCINCGTGEYKKIKWF